MAVGSISEVKAVRVMDDQNVFHADANIQQIVFRSVLNCRQINGMIVNG